MTIGLPEADMALDRLARALAASGQG
jgi:hypothetical protein